MTDPAAIRDILDFWLLPLGDPGYGKPRKMWWNSTPELDAEITAKFGALLEKAEAGELDPWANSPDGALALILLCDQFSRNIHRKTAKAFATDAKARDRTHRSAPLSRVVPARARVLLYAVRHSENLADQDGLRPARHQSPTRKTTSRDRARCRRPPPLPHRNEVLPHQHARE